MYVVLVRIIYMYVYTYIYIYISYFSCALQSYGPSKVFKLPVALSQALLRPQAFLRPLLQPIWSLSPS